MEYLIKSEDQHRVPKGWGSETWICNFDDYCGKILYFESGKKCSWHYHNIKDEVLYLEFGSIVVKYSTEDDINQAQEIALKPGEAFHVKVGLRHQMLALTDSYIFEFSTHHEDSDSIRVIRGD